MNIGRLLGYTVLAFLILLTGCMHPRSSRGTSAGRIRPPVKPTPAQVAEKEKKQREQAKRTLNARIAELERTIAMQKKAYARLDHEIASARKRLAGTQIALRELQKKAAEASLKLDANAAAAASLRKEMGGQHLKTIAVLEAKAVDEKRRREKQDIIIQQRNKEIEELHHAVSARDKMLKTRVRTASEKPAAVKPVAVKSSKVKPATLKSVAPVAKTEPVRTAALSSAQTKTKPREVVQASPVSAVATPASAVVSSDTFNPYAPPVDLVDAGNQFLRDGRISEAEQRFSAALAIDPKMTDATFGLASCRYASGDLPVAKKLVGEVLKAERHNAQAQGLAGIIAWRQGNLKLASKMLSRALKYDPKDAQLHSYMGIVLYAQNKRVPAVRSLLKAIELDPNLPEARFNLAIMLATDNPPKLDAARQHYQASLRLGNARDAKLEKILYQ